MKSNRGSISILMLLIVPIIAIGIFLIYDHLRVYKLDNQVLKSTRNISEIQLANNNAHLFDYYGILAYLDQDIIKSQISKLNNQISVLNVDVDHFDLTNPTNFVEATKMASRNTVVLETIHQIQTLISPYFESEHSNESLHLMKTFEKKAEIFFDFHNEVKSIEKLKTSKHFEAILTSIENEISTKLNEVVKSYETLLQNEAESTRPQIKKYEMLMQESVRTSGEWEEHIADLRQYDKKIAEMRQESLQLKAKIARKTLELKATSETDSNWKVILDEIQILKTQKSDCVHELLTMEEKRNALIDRIIANNKYSKPLLLDKIAHLSSKIDEMLFDLEPVENLKLPSDDSNLMDVLEIEGSELNMLDELIYAEYWMAVLKSFDKGSVRNFNPLGMKSDRDSVIKGEVEYLIAGKLSDPQNVQIIKLRLFSVRTFANMMHIASDASKTSQISRMTAALPMPWNGIAYGAMVTLWSSGEGYLDMISLFKGEGHHFIKKVDEWQLSFDNLMLGSFSNVTETKANNEIQPSDGKLYYQDYLRLMLYIQPNEVIAKRAMFLVDSNIRKASEDQFDLKQFSIGHKIDLSYSLKGLDVNQSVMSLTNKY